MNIQTDELYLTKTIIKIEQINKLGVILFKFQLKF